MAVRGLECACTCPHCGQALIARKGEKNSPHFAHQSEQACKWAVETALHLLAKQIIAESNYLRLPDGSLFYYTETLTEQKCKDITPDVIAKNGEKELFIEIFVTNEVTPSKEKKILAGGLTALEIDLSCVDRNISEDELKIILLDQTELKRMIPSPPPDKHIPSPSSSSGFLTGAVVLFTFLGGLFLWFRYGRKRKYRR